MIVVIMVRLLSKLFIDAFVHTSRIQVYIDQQNKTSTLVRASFVMLLAKPQSGDWNIFSSPNRFQNNEAQAKLNIDCLYVKIQLFWIHEQWIKSDLDITSEILKQSKTSWLTFLATCWDKSTHFATAVSK